MAPKIAQVWAKPKFSLSAPPAVGPRMSPIENAKFHNPDTRPYSASTFECNFNFLKKRLFILELILVNDITFGTLKLFQ